MQETLSGVSGHKGIEANGNADTLAKEGSDTNFTGNQGNLIKDEIRE